MVNERGGLFAAFGECGFPFLTFLAQVGGWTREELSWQWLGCGDGMRALVEWRQHKGPIVKAQIGRSAHRSRPHGLPISRTGLARVP